MKITIDTENKNIIIDDAGEASELSLFSDEAFELISNLWLKVGWNQKYVYTFSWMGRPIIQLPEDMIRMQEVIWHVKPDVIIETGVAHGGSLIFYAALCKAMGKGKIIGIDIDIRPHNRQAIETHDIASFITLIEGSSTEPETIQQVETLIHPDETVLVILDSNHTKEHVSKELNAYHHFVSKGSYIVATDGSMAALNEVPRGKKEWIWDNPTAAAEDFVKTHSDFIQEQPTWPFNESTLKNNITHWPGAWLKRV